MANKKNKQKTKIENKIETKEEKIIFNSKSKKEETKENFKKAVNNPALTTKNNNEKNKTQEIKIEFDDAKKRIINKILIIIAILVIVSAFSSAFAMVHSLSTTIAKGIKIKGIDVSGLTYDEAKTKLNENFKSIFDSNIILNYKDEYKYEISPDDVKLSYDFDDQLKEAYSIGRNKNIVLSNYTLLFTAISKKDINFEYNYDKKIVNSMVEEIATSVPGLVNQYSYYIDGDNLIIKPGTDGIQVDKEKLNKLITDNLKNRKYTDSSKDVKIEIPYKNIKASEIDIDKIYSEVVHEPKDAYYTPATSTEKAKIFTDVDGINFGISVDEAKEKIKEEANEYIVPLTRTKASVTINDIGLEAFPSKLQEFSTRFDASNIGRSENLRIATSKINGTVLMPGEQFSFNKVVGQRTIQEGYKNAAIYAGDGVVEGLAGGICQVSSTLYNLALLANLQIDERYNHSFKTSYLDAGKDATVVYGTLDLKFTNTRSYPIKIEGNAENGVIIFSMYGIEEDVEYTVNIVSKVLETTPYTTKTIQDNSLAPGVQLVDQAGELGYKTTTYKEKILNGIIVSNEVISNDTYRPMTKIVRVGPTSSN